MIDICDSVKEQLQQLRHEAIRFGKPRSGEFVLTDEGRIYRFLSDSNFSRLIVRPIPPRMVPLGPEDVVTNKSIIRTKYGEAVVLSKSESGVGYGPICHSDNATYSMQTATWAMLQKEADYSKHGDGVFIKAEKVAPS